MTPIDPTTVKLAQSGDRAAVERVVRSVTPYVVMRASRFARRYRHVSLDDLKAEGQLGVMIALRKYSPDHGTTFLTYARLWIDAQIREAIARDVSPITACTRTKGIVARGGEVTDEVAKRNRLGRETRAVMHMLSPRSAVGLDAPLGEGATYHDVIGGGENEDEVLEAIDSRRTGAEVNEKLGHLRLRDLEKAILHERLMASEQASLAELGRRFGLSRERVRQIAVRLEKRVREVLTREKPDTVQAYEVREDPEEWLWLPGLAEVRT